MWKKKEEPKFKKAVQLFETIEKINTDDLDSMKTAGEIDAKKAKNLIWKGNINKKSSNPSASFLCLGASEIQRRYLVNLDLDDVEYCK
jgi:hypothetical protein